MNSTRNDHDEDGFTLVEILVVLAITAIVFGLSTLSLSVLKSRTSPGTLAAGVARLLNDAREGAVTHMRPATATIDMKNRTVSSEFDDPVQFPETFKLVVTVGRETVSDTERLQVHFLPDGTSSGVGISISDLAGGKARVETNWLTGLTRQVDASK